jgi:penicillin-binding protein A
VALLALFLFFGTLAYWQVFRMDLAERDGNPRLLADFADPSRGRILDRDGNILAASQPDGTRYYPDASVAHVVGYLDARFGAQGAELAFNNVLSGKSGSGSFEAALRAEFQRDAHKGADVMLTIDPVIQSAAATALGTRHGAVVAIDPRNGQVLAMVSVPTYDPGSLSEAGDALFSDPSSPLLNRSTQGLYPPGSTFKTVTAASALENQVIRPDTVVTCKDEIVIEGFPISCGNVPQGPGTYPFKNAYTFSVNAIFGKLGVDLGWDRLLASARAFGFGSALAFALDTAPTQILADGSERTGPLLASTAFGQGELLSTPLQMALVAAAIANDGTLVEPNIGLRSERDGRKHSTLESPGRRRVMSQETARIMREFMVSVVDHQQASGVQLPGIAVGGKTGTAESGTGGSHAWFIAFAPAENPTIALAVVVEDGGQGGVIASPIAGAVIRAAMNR